MQCFVTGHTGFIGNAIVGDLKKSGHKVIGIVRDENRGHELSKHPDIIVKGDIRDYNFVRRVISDYEIEQVYHCAAQAIVRSCANDPHTTYDINVMGTVSLLEAVRNAGGTVKSVVVSTSDKGFGHAPVPYTEKTPLAPLYTYETSKACQQLITQSYFHNYGVPAKIVACSNVYGPGDPNLSRIIPGSIMKLANDEPAMLFEGVADYIREFVYIDDVVEAFITVANKGSNGEVYCCGGTEHLKMITLLENICKLIGKDPDRYIKLFKKSEYFKEIEKQYIDSTKLRSLGWSPNTSLENGLQKTIQFYTELAGKKN